MTAKFIARRTRVLTPEPTERAQGQARAVNPDNAFESRAVIQKPGRPGEITKDGEPIVGGTDINPKDFAFAGKVYPLASAAATASDASDAKDSKADANTGSEQATSTEPPRTAGTLGFQTERHDAFHLIVMDDFDAETGKTSEEELHFVRLFASYCGARVSAPMRVKKAEGEQSTEFGKIIGTHERLKSYTDEGRGTLPSADEMLAFGGRLFDTLFTGDVRRLYDVARTRQASGKLDLILTSRISWIGEKPWEFAYDASRKSFLATEEVHFVRNVTTAVPADSVPRRAGPLRILVVSAQPVAFDRLSVAQEAEVIRRGFEPLVEAGLAEIEVVARITPAALQGRLATGEFQIVHFIGHGGFEEERGGFLIFEDERGGPVPIFGRSAREIFCQRGLSLVFLNACQTGKGARADFNKGIAQSLVEHGLPALVANQYSVLDSSATSFAQFFYWSLAHGLSVGKAAREARISVNYSGGEPIDWAIPVVYARDPQMTLAEAPSTFVPFPQGAERQVRRQATRGRLKRVALLDIDSVFPSLESTLDTMNAAQNAFAFELVTLSPPLDVWDLEPPAPDGTPYLSADRLAKRMEKKPGELRVDLLICITRHWMRDSEWLNLYGWWPQDGNPRVVVFSLAGFEGLSAEGRATERALANLTVTGMAGFFAQVDSHEKGARNCPFYFDPERDLALQAGPQAFDPVCRAKLERAIPEALPALEALLAAFG